MAEAGSSSTEIRTVIKKDGYIRSLKFRNFTKEDLYAPGSQIPAWTPVPMQFRNFDIKEMKMLTVITGKNGSGKSWFLDYLNIHINNGLNYKVIDKLDIDRDNTNVILIRDSHPVSSNYDFKIKEKFKQSDSEKMKELKQEYDNDPHAFRKKYDSDDSMFSNDPHLTSKELGIIAKNELGFLYSEIFGIASRIENMYRLNQIEQFNQLFKDVFKYDIVYKHDTINNISQSKRFFKNRINKDEITIEQLSSGEKLILLCLLVKFNIETKNVFDKKKHIVLLLDEPDAHFHPSAVHDFIKTVKEIFIEKLNFQVIMTTHNPTTVSFIEKEDLFLLKYNKETDLTTVHRPTKMQIFTELTNNLLIVHQPFKIVFVEGNDARFYEKCVYFATCIYDMFTVKDPLVFKCYETGANGEEHGSCDQIENMVKHAGIPKLKGLIFGIIDNDNKDRSNLHNNLRVFSRHSKENYLYDPVAFFYFLSYLKKQKRLDEVLENDNSFNNIIAGMPNYNINSTLTDLVINYKPQFADIFQAIVYQMSNFLLERLFAIETYDKINIFNILGLKIRLNHLSKESFPKNRGQDYYYNPEEEYKSFRNKQFKVPSKKNSKTPKSKIKEDLKNIINEYFKENLNSEVNWNDFSLNKLNQITDEFVDLGSVTANIIKFDTSIEQIGNDLKALIDTFLKNENKRINLGNAAFNNMLKDLVKNKSDISEFLKQLHGKFSKLNDNEIYESDGKTFKADIKKQINEFFIEYLKQIMLKEENIAFKFNGIDFQLNYPSFLIHMQGHDYERVIKKAFYIRNADFREFYINELDNSGMFLPNELVNTFHELSQLPNIDE